MNNQSVKSVGGQVKPTTSQRKLAVASSLCAIGESAVALDFYQASEKCSYEYVEHALREVLKRQRPNYRFAAKVISAAIAECKSLATP